MCLGRLAFSQHPGNIRVVWAYEGQTSYEFRDFSGPLQHPSAGEPTRMSHPGLHEHVCVLACGSSLLWWLLSIVYGCPLQAHMPRPHGFVLYSIDSIDFYRWIHVPKPG